MSKNTDIEIEIPGPDMKIIVTPPAEPGLPFKAVIRFDYSYAFQAEDPEWKRLMEKLGDWLNAAENSAHKLRHQLQKVQPPKPLVFEEDDARSVLPAPPAEEVVVAETGWPDSKEDKK